MSYLVFARKYRPQCFEDVVAQEHVTRTLQNALRNDRIASGYLFCGPRGTGKTSIARLLAKCVNCIEGPTDKPCGKCPACVEITNGSSLDVLEIDAASNTGVDDIRTLRENVRYLPTSGKKRIYIIDEVHRLSGSAFDALLKTLEEPPEHVIFIFATTDPLKVPETILSRTQRFDFRRVGTEDLREHLRYVAGNEGFEIEDSALKLLARKADGSVRDSLSLLDQIAAFAGDRITEADVVNALGLVDRRFLFDFIEAVAASDRRKVLELIKGLFDSGVEVNDFVLELLDHLRSLMILLSAPQAGELLDLDASEIEEYKKQAGFFSVGDILRMIKTVSDLHTDLKSGLNERLLLETAAVKMAEMESTVRFEEILARMGGQPAGSPGGEPTTDPTVPRREPDMFNGTSTARPAPPTSTADKPSGPISSRAINLPQVQNQWDSFLTHLKKTSPMLASQIRMAELRSLTDNQLQLYFSASADTSLELVRKPENLKIIIQALREFFKVSLSVQFDIDKQKEDPAIGENKRNRSQIDPKELIEHSPRLRSLLDKVDGEIIGIKKAED